MSVPAENVIEAWLSDLEDDKSSQLVRDLLSLVGVFKADKAVRLFFLAPSVTWDAKSQVLAQSNIDTKLTNFLRWLNRHNQWFLLSRYAQAGKKYLAKLERNKYAHVISAVELSASEVESLKSKLSKATGQQIKLENSVDSALIGGLMVDFRGMRYDASLRGRVNQLKKSVLKVNKK